MPVDQLKRICSLSLCERFEKSVRKLGATKPLDDINAHSALLLDMRGDRHLSAQKKPGIPRPCQRANVVCENVSTFYMTVDVTASA